VTLPDGRRVGRVDDVVIDTSTMRAKYLEVKVDHDVLLSDEDRWVLVPIEDVRIEAEAPRVIVQQLPVTTPADVPRHDHRQPTIEEQRAILAYLEIVPPGA
jgi:sporulation protein YlmC with PRC-barrel domain